MGDIAQTELIEKIRRDLDAKCSSWGCPESGTLYDDLHPCTEALCRFRDYLTKGAPLEKWRSLYEEVTRIHATDWIKIIIKIYRKRIPQISCAGIFYYRGGIHTANKAARLIEKINYELDAVLIADPTIQRNYFLRVESLINELESIARGDITGLISLFCAIAITMLILYLFCLLQKSSEENYFGFLSRNNFSSTT